MKELSGSIDGVTMRSSRSTIFSFFGLGLMLGVSTWRSMTCGFAWMPLSASLFIFTVSCFCLCDDLRVMRSYYAGMERRGAELRENRRRLLELGMDHDAKKAEIAGMWKDTTSTAHVGGIILFFVVLSVLVMYTGYIFGCGR